MKWQLQLRPREGKHKYLTEIMSGLQDELNDIDTGNKTKHVLGPITTFHLKQLRIT